MSHFVKSGQRIFRIWVMLMMIVVSTMIASYIIKKFDVQSPAITCVLLLLAILIPCIIGGIACTQNARQQLRVSHLEMLKLARICPHCGYDIRATPERCSECGKSPQEE